MKRIAILLLCVAMLLSVTACKKSKDTGLHTNNTTTTTGEPTDPTYALDPVINRFFVDVITKYGDDVMDVQSIRRAPGTDSTKPEDLIKEYLAVIDGLNISVRNASYTAQPEGQDPYEVYLLRVSIEGGNTTATRDKMLNVFSLIVRAIDPSCTTAMMDAAIDDLKSRTETISSTDYYKISNDITLLHYSPLIPSLGAPTRIEFQTLNYAPPVEK